MIAFEQLQAFFRAGIAGDAVAYAQFLEGVTPYLKRVVARKIGPLHREDVVQEILISIHKARHTYDGVRPVQPWLGAIIQYRITDALRRHYADQRHQTIDITEVEATLADVTEPPADHESLGEILRDVPAREQKILTLLHVEGYTAKEVGKQLNMSESAVKVAAHRAIKVLRKQRTA